MRESPARSVELTTPPSAVIALSDLMAIGVLQELRRQGMRVPDDISVVGIDDITVAQSLAPALTTVAVPLTEMGEIAFSMVRKPVRSQAPPPRSSRHGWSSASPRRACRKA